MAVQVWIGDKPEHANERRAIVALANGLERLEGLYLLLANFHVNGRTIDLTIIKPDGIFIVELKHVDGKVFGDVNGAWHLEDANGERRRLNPGRKNPYNQVISYYYSLTNFLNDNRSTLLPTYKAERVNFRSCRRVIAIAPTIQPGSEINLDWKVELKGLDELPAFLITERSPEIELTEDEMLAIPRLLGMTRWRDVNALMAGVLPTLSVSEEAPPSDTPAPPPAPAPPAPAPTPARPWWHIGGSVRRPAVLGAVLAVVLALIGGGLWWNEANQIPPPPTDTAVAVTPAAPPAGGVLPLAGAPPIAEATTCVWAEYQAVGKVWQPDQAAWLSVGAGDPSSNLQPEVVMTLERVDYCGDEIALTWSVRNNTTRVITFPLRHSNIVIRDPLDNDYMVDDSRSEPRVVRIGPDTVESATVYVSRPVSYNAPSLLVRVKDRPFGEASWLVSLEGS